MLVEDVLSRAALASSFVAPNQLDINDAASIKSVASTIAYGTMSYYTGNVTNTPDTIAVFPMPYYWWQAGACWNAMLDYYYFTGDTSYNDVVTQALLSQVGPDFNLMPDEHLDSLGNDDQAFWTFTILEAAERNFPQPDKSVPSWLQVAENSWNAMAARWNTTNCGGGLEWQVFADNPNGMSYKNSVSNSGFFLMSARLARATGNSTYLDWAEKVWDWSFDVVNFIDDQYNVYDGADSSKNCSDVSALRYTYIQGITLYGAAVMYNYTNGDSAWGQRTTGLLDAASVYFSGFDNVTDVMYEPACETVGACSTDQKSFKGYLSRFMWATSLMMPSTLPQVQKFLNPSAQAAAEACSGGDDGTVCGQKWYTGGFDGSAGLGQQMSALETIQGLLAKEAMPPLTADEIKDIKNGDDGGDNSSHSTTSAGGSQPTSSATSSSSGGLTMSTSTTTPMPTGTGTQTQSQTQTSSSEATSASASTSTPPSSSSPSSLPLTSSSLLATASSLPSSYPSSWPLSPSMSPSPSPSPSSSPSPSPSPVGKQKVPTGKAGGSIIVDGASWKLAIPVWLFAMAWALA